MGRRIREVDAYLEALDPERQATLTDLRSLVLETVPDAVETMGCRMPTHQDEPVGPYRT